MSKINELLKNNSKINSEFLSQQKIKSFYRKIKGLISLRKFKESYDLLFTSYEKDNKSNIIKQLLNFEEMKKFIEIIKEGKENNLGHFNFKKMLLDEKNHFDLENYDDFINPKIEIKFEKGKGIKIIAAEDINLGELILVEKALVFNEIRELKGKILENNLKNKNNNDPSIIDEIDLFNKLAEKVSKSPLDNEKFYYLYNGNNLNEDISQRKKYLEYQENGKTKLNKAKVNGVIFYNKYGIGRYFLYYNSICEGGALPLYLIMIVYQILHIWG